MKNIIQTFYLFLTVFTVMIISCQKESLKPVTELAIDGDQKVIAVEKNGIGIEFCLLNEQGEPATVFNEGEDFTFHLAITNNIKSYEIIYMPICRDCTKFGSNYFPDEFYVFNTKGDTIGRPFYIRGADYSIERCVKINRGESLVLLNIPWTESRDNWHICNMYAHGSKNEALTKGVYYISFSHRFCFRDLALPVVQEKPDEFTCTDNISFKINFEIK
ncbi:MAG: hypothetical protein J7L04_12010 [Bacteroidales bacterium]|nr:hypothetical protein [Bacteroidales bacterium]